MRGRVQFNANVNDKHNPTVIRVTSGDMEFGDSTTSDVEFDRVYVAHKISVKDTNCRKPVVSVLSLVTV